MKNSRPLPLGSTIQFPNRCRVGAFFFSPFQNILHVTPGTMAHETMLTQTIRSIRDPIPAGAAVVLRYPCAPSCIYCRRVTYTAHVPCSPGHVPTCILKHLKQTTRRSRSAHVGPHPGPTAAPVGGGTVPQSGALLLRLFAAITYLKFLIGKG